MKKLRISVNGKQFIVDVEVLEDDEFEPYTQPVYQPKKSGNQPYDPAPNQMPKVNVPRHSHGDMKSLVAPINGVIAEIRVKPGDSVAENDVVIILEAMKMKTNISTPFAGIVKEIHVNINDTIETGQLLLTFE